MKAAEVYAVELIPEPAARAAFIERTRETIRATLHEGKDVPAPALKARDQAALRLLLRPDPDSFFDPRSFLTPPLLLGWSISW